MKKTIGVCAAVLWTLAFSVEARTLSINFVDDMAVDAMLPTDVAGVNGAGTRVANWNNVLADVTGSASGLIYDDGSLSNADITFTSDLGRWRLPITDLTTGDDRMWKGYLDSAGTGSTVTVSGLEPTGLYDVYVYFDGDNGGAWRVGNYTVGAITDGGEDSENTNWGTGQNASKLYQLPVPGPGGNQPFGSGLTNNDEGNYLLFSGVSGSSFTLTAVGGANSDGTPRAPINGFQIVQAIPEPSSAGVLLLGLVGLVVRRRRAA